MTIQKTLSQIKAAQEDAKAANDAYDNLIEQMIESERIFAENGINITVNRRECREKGRYAKCGTVTVLFCDTWLDIRFWVCLGEEGNKQAIIGISNALFGYTKEFNYDFRGSQLIESGSHNSIPLNSPEDAGRFLALMMADLVNHQTQEALSGPMVSRPKFLSHMPGSAQEGDWWGGDYGFILRNKPISTQSQEDIKL